jgi:hypothetical protein
MTWIDVEVPTHGKDEKYVQSYGRENEGTIPLKKPSRKRWDNIKMDADAVECHGMTNLVYDTIQWRAVVTTVMKLRVSSCFSRKNVVH